MKYFLFATLLSANVLAQPRPAAPKPPSAPVAPANAAAAPTPATPVAAAIPSLSESLQGEAKDAYMDGRRLFVDGDHRGALVKFTLAYQKAGDPRLKWNMAACEKNLRHYARVKRLVTEYVAEAGDKLSDEDRKEATELLGVIAPFISKVRIVVAEPGARVIIDEVEVGKTPLADAVEVDIGVHKLRVEKDGYSPFVSDVPVGGAAEITLQAQISRIIHEGELVIKAPENSTIMLDGQVVGKEIYRTKLASGGHTLKVTKPEFLLYQTDVLVEDNKTRTIDVSLTAAPKKGMPTWVFVAIGGVGVAAIAGVVTYYAVQPGDPIKPSGTLTPGSVDLKFW